ncbi:hypothetical protein [Nocardia sp. NPDC004604]|uniref:hypothetical protein n=1 Tax=Nocardia sp. NPDC004604 TaxID=3157013 RepID=UPI0033BBD97F
MRSPDGTGRETAPRREVVRRPGFLASSIMSTPNTARLADAGAHDARAQPIARRCAALTAAALTTMAATVVLAPAAHAATVHRPMENAAAGAAVVDLTSGGPGSAAAIPADFVDRFGYRPTVVDGLLVNPNGDCSSPVTLPAEFETACKAHDLGYDLLRYAGERDEPLAGWARQDLDATLATHMHEACASRDDAFSRARCNAMASIAYTFVDLNSRRQDYGVPVLESVLGAQSSESGGGWLAWLAGVVGLGVVLAGVLPSARRRAEVRTPARFSNRIGAQGVEA